MCFLMVNYQMGVYGFGYYEDKNPLVRGVFKNRVKEAIKIVSLNEKSTILDIGSAWGYLLKSILDRYPSCKCTGIDSSQRLIMNTKIENCNLGRADARNLPFHDESFEVVFILDVLEHIEEKDIVINEIHRVLKKNGIVILSGPTESWFYKFCRFLWLRKTHLASHKYTIYQLETGFLKNNFKLMQRTSIPQFPLPELFGISKFKKI